MAPMSKGTETRQVVLDEAARGASRVGLSGLTIGSLAAATQLSKSGLFAHFQSKESLQLQLLDHTRARFIDLVVRPALAAPRGEPRVRELSRRWLAWDAEALPGGCLFVAASAEFDAQPGPVRDRLANDQRDRLGTHPPGGPPRSRRGPPPRSAPTTCPAPCPPTPTPAGGSATPMPPPGPPAPSRPSWPPPAPPPPANPRPVAQLPAAALPDPPPEETHDALQPSCRSTEKHDRSVIWGARAGRARAGGAVGRGLLVPHPQRPGRPRPAGRAWA